MHHYFDTFLFKVKRAVYLLDTNKLSADKLSATEKKYFEEAVKEGGKQTAEIIKKIKNGEVHNVEEFIENLYNSLFPEDDLLVPFTDRVYKEADGLLKQAKDETEKKIVEDSKGKIVILRGAPGGKDLMRTAGVQVKKRAKTLPGKFFSFFSGGIGEEHMQKVNEDLRFVNTEAPSERKALELRLEECLIKRGSMSGARVFLSNLVHLDTAGREAASKERARLAQEQKSLEKELKRSARELAQREEKLKKDLARIEADHQKWQKRFDDAFMSRLDFLKKHKSEMTEDDYDARMKNLREEVRKFGDDRGIIYMEYFLNKALAVEPVTYVYDKTSEGRPPVYKKPETPIEESRERARVSKWWRKVFGVEIGEEDLDRKFIPELRKENPSFLTDIMESRVEPDVEEVLAFLYQGKLEGKIKLPTKRRAKLDPINVVGNLKLATEVSSDSDWKEHLKIFAENWQDYSMESLSNAYSLIKAGVTVPKGTPSAATGPGERNSDDVKGEIKDSFNLSTMPVAEQDKIVEHLYNSIMKDSTEYQHMIEDENTRLKLQFFIIFKFDNGIHAMDLTAKATPPTINNLDDAKKICEEILTNIALIHKLDDVTFIGAAKEYFTKQKKATASGFLKYLKTEYGT